MRGVDGPATVSKIMLHNNIKRSVIASVVGAGIEWYDFMLYGAAAALVFPTLFFPHASPATGVLLAFSTYFVGFLARPLGAAIFGHVGDRFGRKKSLLATITLMGIGTVGIGLAPSYESVGVAGPILLVFLRCLQGIGLGGEWGGAALLAMESGSRGSRGFRASFPQAVAMLAIGAANLAFLATGVVMSTENFMTWGWRIPFLASAVLVAVGLWIRRRVPETEEFRELECSGRITAAPLVRVAREWWPEIVLTALLKSAEMIPVYLFITFILSYGTRTLSYDRNSLLLLVSLGAVIAALATPIIAWYADRAGYRRVYVAGAVAVALYTFAYFAIIDSGFAVGSSIVIVLSLLPCAAIFAVEPALIADRFPPEIRYSGASLGFNLAGVIGGGPAPFVAAWLVTHVNSTAVAAYVAVFCAIGISAVRALSRRGHAVLPAGTDRMARDQGLWSRAS